MYHFRIVVYLFTYMYVLYSLTWKWIWRGLCLCRRAIW